MGNWIAGLVAFVIAGLVMLAIMRLNGQAHERSVSATQQRAVRTSQMALLEMIERDFQNIGSNHPNYDLPPDSAIIEWDTSGTDRAFAFIGQTVRGMPPDTVRYTWSTTETKELKAGTVNVYQVQRWVNSEYTGGAAAVVTRFDVTLLLTDGTPTSVLSAARQIQVGISMISNLGESTLMGEADYDWTIRPATLARLDFEPTP